VWAEPTEEESVEGESIDGEVVVNGGERTASRGGSEAVPKLSRGSIKTSNRNCR